MEYVLEWCLCLCVLYHRVMIREREKAPKSFSPTNSSFHMDYWNAFLRSIFCGGNEKNGTLVTGTWNSLL